MPSPADLPSLLDAHRLRPRSLCLPALARRLRFSMGRNRYVGTGLPLGRHRARAREEVKSFFFIAHHGWRMGTARLGSSFLVDALDRTVAQ